MVWITSWVMVSVIELQFVKVKDAVAAPGEKLSHAAGEGRYINIGRSGVAPIVDFQFKGNISRAVFFQCKAGITNQGKYFKDEQYENIPSKSVKLEIFQFEISGSDSNDIHSENI